MQKHERGRGFGVCGRALVAAGMLVSTLLGGVTPVATPVASADTCTGVTLQVPRIGPVCADHWMRDEAAIIGQRPLNQVVVPGSHDSGAYLPDCVGFGSGGC